MTTDDFTAVIVTRGDVDLIEIVQSLIFLNVVVWDNGGGKVPDLKAFGRYAACHYHATTRGIYTQDDDALVPVEAQRRLVEEYDDQGLVSNMPAEHNLGHPLLALPGWGSVFRRDLPLYAFKQWVDAGHSATDEEFLTVGCDIVFPVLTPSRRLDLGHTDLPHAHALNRTHLRADYRERKQWYYDTAAELRANHAA